MLWLSVPSFHLYFSEQGGLIGQPNCLISGCQIVSALWYKAKGLPMASLNSPTLRWSCLFPKEVDKVAKVYFSRMASGQFGYILITKEGFRFMQKLKKKLKLSFYLTYFTFLGTRKAQNIELFFFQAIV